MPPQPVKKYPYRFGKYVMQFVYDTMDPEISDYLRVNNPNPGGKFHHHQLFNDFGYKNLQDHLIAVLGIMKASINMERFKENISIAFPNAKTQRFVRLQNAREISQSSKSKSSKKKPNNQVSMFNYIPTINTDNKEQQKVLNHSITNI